MYSNECEANATATHRMTEGIRTGAAKNVQMVVLRGLAPYQQGEMMLPPA